MRVRARKSSRGFTLVELLIGATLSAAIMAAVLSSYLYLGRGLARLANQQKLETEGRRTLGYFTQDVAAATTVTVTTTTAPDFYITFTVPTTATGVRQVIYRYSQAGGTISVGATIVTIPARSLVRVAATASALVVSSQTLLSNIVTGNNGCYIRFYDAAGTAYDNGSAPYTPVTAYSLGIKQAMLAFQTQLGSAAAGTQTPMYAVASGRLVMRNKTFLP